MMDAEGVNHTRPPGVGGCGRRCGLARSGEVFDGLPPSIRHVLNYGGTFKFCMCWVNATLREKGEAATLTVLSRRIAARGGLDG